LVGAIPPWLPLYLAVRGSAQGHDPYPFILFQAQRIWYEMLPHKRFRITLSDRRMLEIAPP